MKMQHRRLLQPGLWVPFASLLVFCCITLFFSRWLALCEFVFTLILFAVLLKASVDRARKNRQALDAAVRRADDASQNAILEVPVPMVIIRMDTESIIWCNHAFAALDSAREIWYDVPVSDVMPALSLGWLADEETERPDTLKIGDRTFSVRGSRLQTEDQGGGALAAVFLLDETETVRLQEELDGERSVVALIRMDNYEEVTRSMTSNERNYLIARIDEQVFHWTELAHGACVKNERDNWVFLFEARYMSKLSDFEILQSVRTVSSGGIPPTISIGIGKNGENLGENLHLARLALDMALTRGGDQAVVKDPLNYAFFGGRSREVEQRNRVRARVMAGALTDLIRSSDNVLVMGHSFSDMDSLGSCVGVVCACRKFGVPANIVINLKATAARPLYERLTAVPEFRDTFIDTRRASELLNANTLVVVTDVNRANYVDAPEILPLTSRIVVIDHHRKVADFIENPILSLHEPYASSASELVCELLQYIVQPNEILRAEAEALLAGISLDTKNFTMKTGVRTFEAAAFLRRAGADTISVKQLFQNDMDNNILLCEILRTASRFRGNMAIATCDREIDRAIGGQAADEMLNIRGVEASFVIFITAGSTNISARSLGTINVQVIMERLGGGGSVTGAGVQLGGVTPAEAAKKLTAAIESYFALA